MFLAFFCANTCHVWSWSFANRWLTGTIVPVTFIRLLLFLGIWCYVNSTQDSIPPHSVCSKPKNMAISTAQNSQDDLVNTDWKVSKVDRALMAGVGCREGQLTSSRVSSCVHTFLFGMVLCKVHDLCKECSGDSAAEGQVFSDLSLCFFWSHLTMSLGLQGPDPWNCRNSWRNSHWCSSLLKRH